MKCSKSEIILKSQQLPELRFEDQHLTSFSGLILFQQLFILISLREKLRLCFRHLRVSPIFGHGRIVLLLVVHFVLGYRTLRELRYYADDPMIYRVVGLKRMPDVATISRYLSSADALAVDKLQTLLRQMVLERLATLNPRSVTLDFDGSVIGTGRYAEGTAIGFNRKKKGQRSYYPLFCTIAQTSQVFDVLHRSGNVHDSNGAQAFIRQCIAQIRKVLPGINIELRMDGAFFSQDIVDMLDKMQVEYSISVPFSRLTALKQLAEQRQRWTPVSKECAAFEVQWKPKAWPRRHRFVFIRKAVRVQSKQPVQLDLFEPYDCGYDFKVILTNKTLTAAKLMNFHNGRGSQEGIFAELKSGNAMAYVPSRTWIGNQIYLVAALMAHNLSRELQMRSTPAQRKTGQKRPALWSFASIATLRRRLIQRAGRLIYPQGKFTLSMSTNATVEKELLQMLDALKAAA